MWQFRKTTPLPEEMSEMEKLYYETLVSVKNDFFSLELNADSINDFMESIRCPDDQHQWEPLLFNSRCAKCFVFCNHLPDQKGNCEICGVEFEKGVAPFHWNSIKHG